MARIESIAVGGYYPTPIHLIPYIARMLLVQDDGRHFIVDPCAGDGEAVDALIEALGVTKNTEFHLVELEATRYENLRQKHWRAQHGDIFCLEWEKKRGNGATILYLNPPYNTDPIWKRLEEKFLNRCTPMLSMDGVLIFIVPFYALNASATTLARSYRNLRCYRFPKGDWEEYKQIVLFAQKGYELPTPDEDSIRMLRGWASDANSIPVLGETDDAPIPLVTHSWDSGGFYTWNMQPLDFNSLLPQIKPWHFTGQSGNQIPIQGVFPNMSAEELLCREYPVAMPPRPAHIAAAIAAGVFNGSHVTPDDSESGLPSLLVKGVFDKEYRTIEEKKDEDGAVTAEVQVQQPNLVTTVLDISRQKYITLRSSPETTGTQSVDAMTTADLLTRYGRSLMNAMLRQCPVMFDPSNPDDLIPLAQSPRRLFQAQENAVRAAVKLIRADQDGMHRGNAVYVLGEIGSGKSTVALITAATLDAKRILIVCPPHLVQSWIDQTTAVLPDAQTVVIKNDSDLSAINENDRPGIVVAVLSRESAKLGHTWASVKGRCPKCGIHLEDRDFAKKRERCTHSACVPVDSTAQIAHRLARYLAPLFPSNTFLTWTLSRSRMWAKALDHYKTQKGNQELTQQRILKLLQAIPHVIEDMLQTIDPTTVEEHRLEAILGLVWAHTDRNVALSTACSLYKMSASNPESWGLGEVIRNKAREAFLIALPDDDEQKAIIEEMTAICSPKYHYGGGNIWQEWQKKVNALRNPTLVESDYIYRYYKVDNDVYYRKNLQRGDPAAAIEALEYAVNRGSFHFLKTCNEPLFKATPAPRRIPLATRIAHKYPRLFDFLAVDECFPGYTPISVLGGTKNIEDIQIGDLVWSRTSAGRLVLRKVIRKFHKPNSKGLIRVSHEHGHLDSTPDHRYWTEEHQNYVQARKLMDNEPMQSIIGGTYHADDHQDMHRLPDIIHLRPTSQARAGMLWESLFRSTPKSNIHAIEQRDGTTLHRDVRMVQDSRRSWGIETDTSILLQAVPANRTLAQQSRATPKSLRTGSPVGHARMAKTILRTRETNQFRPHCACQNIPDPQGENILWDEGRERHINPRAIDTAAKTRMGCGSSHPDREPEVEGCCGRSSSSNLEDRSGVRWRFPSYDQTTQPGSNERPNARIHRLGGFTLLELTNHNGSRFSAGGSPGTRGVRIISVEKITRPEVEWVWDLEIEETHCYFAGGILVHNCHEYATDGSAQERAAHRLTALNIPTLLLTGTVMNGYAESLFANMWALSRSFRDEYKRDEVQQFVDRYGYRKRLVIDKDKQTGEVVRFGTMSDRVERSERRIGNAPGVLPLFLLRHLLPIAVTIHKSDLAIDLPPCREDVINIHPDSIIYREYESLLQALIKQIRADQFSERAGKLWGQMAEIPSYLDRCTLDTGNTETGNYVIRYPETMGGEVVASAMPIPENIVLPKERWMIDQIRSELNDDRNVMVFAWHTNLMPRFAKMIEREIGEKCAILDANKVSAPKRQDWIDREIIRKGRRVMVVNPIAVQTGLNNLVHFATEIWMENPACNPVTYRQASGRIDRIGQTKATRILFPIYAGTAQEQLHALLMHKVGVSMSTDGLDAESALQAAGVAEDNHYTGMNIGKELYRLLVEEKSVNVARVKSFAVR